MLLAPYNKIYILGDNVQGRLYFNCYFIFNLLSTVFTLRQYTNIFIFEFFQKQLMSVHALLFNLLIFFIYYLTIITNI